tara:strand:+ start:2896 stop:3099 length:204 start_codon:yes stop_codon:yes gene_type:complete
MSKSKQLFTESRESEVQTNFDNGEFLHNQWMSHLEAQKNHKSNQAVDILNELFVSFGNIYGLKKQSK